MKCRFSSLDSRLSSLGFFKSRASLLTPCQKMVERVDLWGVQIDVSYSPCRAGMAKIDLQKIIKEYWRPKIWDKKNKVTV